MADSTTIVAIKARWLLPLVGAPVDGGVISIAGERIASVGENLSSSPVIDLGDVAILPGLVNAHTHLEFSELTAPLGLRGEPLPMWIRRVIDYRHSRTGDPQRSIEQGLLESLAAGVTMIGEIATSPWQSQRKAGPDCLVFQEHIGLSPDRLAIREAAALEHLQMPWPQSHAWPGLSPHAPYTVHLQLLERLVELASQYRVRLAMHLAESREELELLQSGTGPFHELLTGLGAWIPDVIPRGARPLDYLQRLAAAPRALVIHGNYLSRDEQQLLATSRDRMSVVYCPRTHDYFGHDDYPLAAMLAAGVHVALGTDSRASNPDLHLWSEARFVAERHKNVCPQTAVELATIRGAEALGLGGEVGTLEPGKLANLAIVRLGDQAHADPFEAALQSTNVRAIWRGQGVDSLVTL